MKPCKTIQYDEWWLEQNKEIILPDPNTDMNFYRYLNSDFDDINGVLQIATAIKVNGMNQSFISIVKERHEGAIAHCEFYISPTVNAYYRTLFQDSETEKLISVGLGYFLTEWFDIDELYDAHILSYWALAPGPLRISKKRKRHFEEGKFKANLKRYAERYNISDKKLEYFANKLQMDGISRYLGVLNPHVYLEYQHVMDVLTYYLYKDTKLAGQLAMLYFPPGVIDDVLKM